MNAEERWGKNDIPQPILGVGNQISIVITYYSPAEQARNIRNFLPLRMQQHQHQSTEKEKKRIPNQQTNAFLPSFYNQKWAGKQVTNENLFSLDCGNDTQTNERAFVSITCQLLRLPTRNERHTHNAAHKQLRLLNIMLMKQQMPFLHLPIPELQLIVYQAPLHCLVEWKCQRLSVGRVNGAQVKLFWKWWGVNNLIKLSCVSFFRPFLIHKWM